MNHNLWMWLSAQSDGVVSWEELQQHWRFNTGGLTTPPVFWTSLGVVAVVLGSLAAWRWYRNRRGHMGLMGLFLSLAGDLGLSAADQWLLLRITWRQALPSPLTLMLSSATLRHHARLYARDIASWRRKKIIARADRIDRTLFGAAG